MTTNRSKLDLVRSGLAASVLLLAGAGAFAQSVNLTAAPTSTLLPDGQSVPMWGYSCDATQPDQNGLTSPAQPASCAALSTKTGWSPVRITVPYVGAGTSLTINLTNKLTFNGGATTLPTSIVIVGQLGGGLGGAPTTTPSPVHGPQGPTWPASGGPDPSITDCSAPGAAASAAAAGTNCPPPQPPRVQSFATEVAAGATKALTWGNLRPGTYLIHSGTHPSIQHPMGLYGVLVVTNPGSGSTIGYPGVNYDAEVPLLLSEIDPVQNAAVDTAVGTTGFSPTKVWSGLAGKCGDISDTATAEKNTCFPPAVNYDPRYYLINGVSFDRTALAASTLAGPASGAVATTGNVLLRFVNAGLRMHVPQVVGASMTLYAEDGNILPGVPKVQNQVFLAAGKTYDVTISPVTTSSTPGSTYASATLPIYDRQLSLSTNNQRDGGMQAYIAIAGGAGSGIGTQTGSGTAVTLAAAKTYYCVAGTTLNVADPGKGVLAGSAGANGAVLDGAPALVEPAGFAFQPNGTFTYTTTGSSCGGTFSFKVNGTTSASATIAQCDASTPACASLGGAPVATNDSYTSVIATRLQVNLPGVLGNDSDPSGLPLKAVLASSGTCGAGLKLNEDGSFTVDGATPACSFTYNAVNTQKTASVSPATVTVTFPPATGINVVVKDAKTGVAITDYRWIIEEDRTFWVDPKCQINSTDPTVRPSSCPPLPVESIGYNFHTANMPVVAQGCMGKISCEYGQTLLNNPTACDIGNGQCRQDGSADRKTAIDPKLVHLDPTKRYFISVLPGDGVNPVIGGAGGPDDQGRPFDIATACGPYTGPTDAWEPGGAAALCGHAMGGAQISKEQVLAGSATNINISVQQTPLPTSKIAVFVFADDNPLNGENDAGGGVDIIAPNEPGLGGFEIKLFDQAGGLGDATGQITYDMFNMPVSNALAGTIDPLTKQDACPITRRGDGLVGMIPTCPKFMADGHTPSPLAGQAIIANLYPGLYEVVATAGADRIARGEEWLQTNTLDGGKPHEAFIKPNEPGYFQEFGPGGFHVSIGFANPKIINDRAHNTAGTGICDPKPRGGGLTCNSSLVARVTNNHMSRTPDQRTFSSGGNEHFGFTNCYLSLGPADGPDFAFAKCDSDGVARFTNIPNGDFKLTVFDQWNDIMLDGLVNPVTVNGTTGTEANPVVFPVTQWRTNVYTRTFIDTNRDGVSQPDEPGLPLVATNIRYRDGSFGFFNNTDLNGYAGFNEVFPFMNWLVVETYSTRYKVTGVHTVNDVGGPVDGTPDAGTWTSGIAAGLASTRETNSLPEALRVPGAVYCDNADCAGFSIANGKYYQGTAGNSGADPTGTMSSGRIDPPWGATQGWQGLLGQNNFIEWGMKPFAENENGGIQGHVIYASTRPFDDPALLLQLSWEPGVPRVRINLYQQGVAADGSKSLKLVDTTTTTSWDDWAQGFRTDGIPNMNCPGQDPTSPFFQTLRDSKQWLDPSNPKKELPNHSQFKCYDGWSQLNQVQPAPYDGMYKFPSVTSIDPVTGRPAGTNCTICSGPNGTDTDGLPMLPPGKYVVEVIVPTGYELVKEEDKNILLGDVYVAPVTQQFAGLGNIFIMPDQAAVNAYFNKNNPLNQTTNLGATPRHEGDTGSVEVFWPCVGNERIVPDFNSLFPGAGQNAPFAGAKRPLCDRKEVTLQDQTSALAKFYIFSSTHIAGHFTGLMTNDFASEFDPFSPQFGEKFGPPNLPVGMRDFSGTEVARVYADQWGVYNGLYFSSYGVNPPNPTGYVPQMAIACMNDPGPIPDPSGAIDPGTGKIRMITDPAYNPAYSNFCYEMPFMPGFTAYMDTPVIPTMAFAEGYNLPDCDYPDATPAIKSVIGADSVGAVGGSSGKGPWVSGSGAGHTLTITALGDKVVQNPNFSGPNATAAPFNQKTVTRHYGFGATAGTVSLVDVNGNAHDLTNVTWSDGTITGRVPNGVAQCSMQQRGPGNGGARCGELVITTADGKRSIDSITVTIGGKPPTYVTPTDVIDPVFGRTVPSPLQKAIDAATPGDLILVGPGTYKENLLMWKPVRLQGVGAASVTINADAHPAGKLDSWRNQVNCLFGLALNGQPITSDNPYDPSGTYVCPAGMRQQADRIPFEGILGWDVTVNGNLAQMMQEPTLMGAYEGAGITALAKGVAIPRASVDYFGAANSGGYPAGYRWLNDTSDCQGTSQESRSDPNGSTVGRDYATSNFLCNPSRIDGVSVINSSQGGGAIFLHAWNHKIEIANNRISANHGTLTGGITIGTGEFPDPFLIGGDVPLPYSNDGSIGLSTKVDSNGPGTGANLATGEQAGYGFQRLVNVHHNSVTSNASIGDALFSGTPSGAGGVTFCNGSDYYKFNYNWICGNLSTGDGAGVVHSGFSNGGDMSHNWILFNQSVNPTLPTNGGGVSIIGASPDRTLATGIECGAVTDQDCPPGLPEGTGRNLTIDANLIMGNSAESGTGGGLRLQSVNGQEVAAFPLVPGRWYGVSVTNNIIVNNVAGWDGGGVSLQDSLKVSFVNNTVVANDTTASAGSLFKSLGSAFASAPPPNCDPGTSPDASCYGPDAPNFKQPAGLVTMENTPNLKTALSGGTAVCPPGFGYTGILGINGDCKLLSKPLLKNDLFWQNRAFNLVLGGFGEGIQNKQHLVTLQPALNQTVTGECAAGANYWDIGVRGDTTRSGANIWTPGNPRLAPSNSILTFLDTYGGNGNMAPAGSPVNAQYCNGSRVPPENGGKGYNVPVGQSETTGIAQEFRLFGITPAATVDEGNNWINLSYGPLTLHSSEGKALVATASKGAALGAYSIHAGSPAVNAGDNSGAPQTDFFGANRALTNANRADIGAVELQPNALVSTVLPAELGFGFVNLTTTSGVRTLTLTSGSAGLTVPVANIVITAPYTRSTTAPGTCATSGTITLAASTLTAANSCTINIVFTPTVVGASNGTVTISATTGGPVQGSPVALNGTGISTQLLVAPAAVAFADTLVNTTSAVQFVTLTNSSIPDVSVTGISVVVGGQFVRSLTTPGTCPTTPTFTLVPSGASCTVGVQFAPTAVGPQSGSVTVTAPGFTIGGSPVALSGTATPPTADLSITKTDGLTTVGAGTAVHYTIIVSNPSAVGTGAGQSNATVTGATVTDNVPAAVTGVTWTCAASAGSSCATPSGSGNSISAQVTLAQGGTATFTVNGTVNTTVTGAIVNTASVAVPATVVDPNPANNSATDTDASTIRPTLGLLDNFNRTTGLGGNWQQLAGAVGISSNEATCTGALACLIAPGTAYWNATTFGAKQAAAMLITNNPVINGQVPVNGASLILKAGGGTAPANFIRVRYSGGNVLVETTNSAGITYSAAGTLAQAFVTGDTLTAMVDDLGMAYVWRTTAASVTSFVGNVQLPTTGGNAFTTGGGRIGIQVPTNSRVDNFAGGTVTP